MCEGTYTFCVLSFSQCYRAGLEYVYCSSTNTIQYDTIQYEGNTEGSSSTNTITDHEEETQPLWAKRKENNLNARLDELQTAISMNDNRIEDFEKKTEGRFNEMERRLGNGEAFGGHGISQSKV